MAVIDTLLQLDNNSPEVRDFLSQQEQIIKLAEKVEYNMIQRTRVDFKMMEQA